MLKEAALPHISELPNLEDDHEAFDGAHDLFAGTRPSPLGPDQDEGVGLRALFDRPEALLKRRRSTNDERDFDFNYRAKPRQAVRARKLRHAS